jgi:hypothetical protein
MWFLNWVKPNNAYTRYLSYMASMKFYKPLPKCKLAERLTLRTFVRETPDRILVGTPAILTGGLHSRKLRSGALGPQPIVFVYSSYLLLTAIRSLQAIRSVLQQLHMNYEYIK